jgi:hypothetical protein
MAVFAVIEILNEDGSAVTDDFTDFERGQLRWAEADRKEGYVRLDTTNYVFPARIDGTLRQVDAEGFEADPVHRIDPL